MNGAPVSTVLLALIVVASAVAFRSPAFLERNLLRPYFLLRQREFGTLVTSGFIHGSLGHLLFNGFTFWAFAFALERRLGSLTFFNLYAFGLLVSSLGSWVRHRNDPAYRTLGASGAILAVLFASIVYNPGASIFVLPLPVPIPAPLFGVLYLAFSIYASRRGQGRINHDAHIAGAIAGIVFAWASNPAALRQLLQELLH
jgi:membrane associated rhomboid family serine protease